MKKTIHQQNLEFLAKEIYNFVNGLSQLIMSDFITVRGNPYNLYFRLYIRPIKEL